MTETKSYSSHQLQADDFAMKENKSSGQELRWVGRPISRKDGAGKVTGETKFFSDMIMPNMLWAKAVRSKYPHALIKRINTAKAEAAPGS